MIKYYYFVASLIVINLNGQSPITQRLDQLYSRILDLRKEWGNMSLKDQATHTTQEQQARKKAYEDIRELLTKYEPTVDDLIIAAILNELYLMQLFLNAGVSVNAKNKFQETALMAAAKYGQPESVQFLIEKGADIFARNYKGRTAKDLASEAKGLTSHDVFVNINPGLVLGIGMLSNEQRIMQTLNILARAMKATAPQAPAMPRARL